MATSVFFNNWESSQEQTLIADLIIEAIRIHGLDTMYMPRTIVNRDPLMREDTQSAYNSAHQLEMHFKGINGFGGMGDFLSTKGDEISDSMTLVVAIRRFNQEIKDFNGQLRPNEGDLVYLPLNRKVFKVVFVEHEAIFYQMGTLQVYELKCELFEYSGETFNTGIDYIDSMTDGYDTSPDGLGIGEEDEGFPILPEDFEGLDNALLGEQNEYYQREGLKIIDFSEIDPFVDGENW